MCLLWFDRDPLAAATNHDPVVKFHVTGLRRLPATSRTPLVMVTVYWVLASSVLDGLSVATLVVAL